MERSRQKAVIITRRVAATVIIRRVAVPAKSIITKKVTSRRHRDIRAAMRTTRDIITKTVISRRHRNIRAAMRTAIIAAIVAPIVVRAVRRRVPAATAEVIRDRQRHAEAIVIVAKMV
jgi:hypothetical protein